MNTYETLLEIKTAKKDLSIKAIYIHNSVYWGKGTYFTYYYDLKNHTIYIDDITEHLCQDRISLSDILENVVTKIYLKEINKYWKVMKRLLEKNNPSVIYFNYEKFNEVVAIKAITLKPIKDIKWIITGFKKPKKI